MFHHFYSIVERLLRKYDVLVKSDCNMKHDIVEYRLLFLIETFWRTVLHCGLVSFTSLLSGVKLT